MNESRKVLHDLIANYVENIDLYNCALKEDTLGAEHNKRMLDNMEVTAKTMILAVRDLRKEILK